MEQSLDVFPRGHAHHILLLQEIEPYDLVNGLDSVHVIHFESVEEYEGQDAAPEGVCKDTHELDRQKLVVARVEQAFVNVEKTRGNYGPNAAKTVDFRDVKRVVYFKSVSDFSRLSIDYGAHDSDYGSCAESDVGARPRYANEACQDSAAELVNIIVVQQLSFHDYLLVLLTIIILVCKDNQKARSGT